MTAAPLATVDDLSGWLGQPLTGVDASRAEAVLTRVSSLVRSEAGRSWTDDPVPDDVAAVVIDVAARVFLNPANVRSTTTGPFSVTYAFVGLHLLPEERRVLAAYKPGVGGLRTIATTRGDLYPDTIYVPTAPAPSGQPFPFLSAADDL